MFIANYCLWTNWIPSILNFTLFNPFIFSMFSPFFDCTETEGNTILFYRLKLIAMDFQILFTAANWQAICLFIWNCLSRAFFVYPKARSRLLKLSVFWDMLFRIWNSIMFPAVLFNASYQPLRWARKSYRNLKSHISHEFFRLNCCGDNPRPKRSWGGWALKSPVMRDLYSRKFFFSFITPINKTSDNIDDGCGWR